MTRSSPGAFVPKTTQTSCAFGYRKPTTTPPGSADSSVANLDGPLPTAAGPPPDTQTIILSKARFDPEHSCQYQVRAEAEHPNLV